MHFGLHVIAAAVIVTVTNAFPFKRSFAVEPLSSIKAGDLVFQLEDVLYLAATSNPIASFPAEGSATGYAPLTIVKIDSCTVDLNSFTATIQSYADGDDVFSNAFLDHVLISSNCTSTVEVASEVSSYLTSVNGTFLGCSSGGAAVAGIPNSLSPGPYLASIDSSGAASISMLYRLYNDEYRDFVYGVYPTSDLSTYQAVPNVLIEYQDPLIPVPSRIYSRYDTRPFAGQRIAIKDLYDLAGTKTSAGSRAWTEIISVANVTAPAIQRIIDLGGIIVGKQKMAQFASGADPWDWYDVHYPFNPRADSWLTCSASSSGAGCSMAAYDWLDHAIGSDTGSSVRRPASVSGTYGNRPSQGMISLEGVNPLGAAQDTAGAFGRDPVSWVAFAKDWYTPDLHQDPSINGLEPLSVPDSYEFPDSVYYDPDYLPIRNPAANDLVLAFYSSLNSALNITKITTNLTRILQNNPIRAAHNTTYRNNASNILNSRTQWLEVASPLLTAWASKYNNRFPPIDPARRPAWISRTPETITEAQYTAALEIKRNFSEWMNHAFLGNNNPTMGSCADSSLWIYDVGTGGLPSYREEDLLSDPSVTARLNYTPPGVLTSGVSFCSFAGCADYTIPIGQVPYFSNITQYEEMVPVTVSVVAKRGCDFVLFNLIARLAELGVLKTVKTGRTAF